MKACLKCKSIFNRELKEGIICPTLFCSGKVVEIDDAILHTILLLNQKGYRTAYCCSGHTWGNDPFIVFDERMHPEGFSSVPRQFSVSAFQGRLRLSKSISKGNAVKRQKELMKASVELITWADKLPPAQYVEVDFIIPNLINEDDFIKEVEQLLHLDFIETDDVNDFVEGKKRITLDKIIDPLAFEKLRENIESFADKKGFEVNMAIYEQ